MRKFKKRRKKLYTRKIFLLNSILVVFLFLGLGYSILNTELFITGSLKVKAQLGPTLYNVLKLEATTGGLAKEYTEEHHDSFIEEPIKKIYHWYAENDTEGTAILNKNNVIFADHCWQMIRTTDTGGVKMIYNGEAEGEKCLNTRGTHVGYASRTSQKLSSQYWYGTNYTYDSTAKTFKVSGTTEQATWDETTGPGLIGKYTCKSTSVDGTCSTLYLVESYYNTTSAYVIPLNSNSHYSQFGKLKFNESYQSLSDAGYMYNKRYPRGFITLSKLENFLSTSSLGTNYWYAHSVTWGDPVADKYNLDSPYRVSSTNAYPNLVGEYTFRNATQTYTNTTVQYIAAVDGSSYYYFNLQGGIGINPELSNYNYSYTYGDSYRDNGDGTYTINNPITIHRSDWYTNYNNVNNKYVCRKAVDNTCSNLWYAISTSKTDMKYFRVENNYKYAKGYTYDENSGVYTLNNDSVTFFEINDINRTSLNNAHYTCLNTSGECTTLFYVYAMSTLPNSNENEIFYIKLTEGISLEDALNEMLYNDNVNTKNSTIKSGVDAWYKQYLLEDYDEYIEDTIFCNDRSQSNASTNGWNPNGGNITEPLYYKEYENASGLSCTNTTDQFSVSNNNAKLTYKVGLVTNSEMYILNNKYIRKTGQIYWSSSPQRFTTSVAGNISVDSTGDLSFFSTDSAFGVRPVISLKPGTKYISGNGSMEQPYIIQTNS